MYLQSQCIDASSVCFINFLSLQSIKDNSYTFDDSSTDDGFSVV